ncbi:hypothetical protein [Kingella oralis]|nr:hypothetical protein [Kingella oralis]QMT42126.1 hypothetical protein H3L93_08895 [Kingella oralis]
MVCALGVWFSGCLLVVFWMVFQAAFGVVVDGGVDGFSGCLCLPTEAA